MVTSVQKVKAIHAELRPDVALSFLNRAKEDR
jgi:hypothetical protein